MSYIDPRVDSQTRTTKVRLEVANPGGRLRLGMYVNMTFAGLAVSRRSSFLGRQFSRQGTSRWCSYRWRERRASSLRRIVRLGPASGDSYVVLEGLRAGDTVVTEGSFLLRAEAAKSAS